MRLRKISKDGDRAGESYWIPDNCIIVYNFVCMTQYVNPYTILLRIYTVEFYSKIRVFENDFNLTK